MIKYKEYRTSVLVTIDELKGFGESGWVMASCISTTSGYVYYFRKEPPEKQGEKERFVCINCGKLLSFEDDGIVCDYCKIRVALPLQEYIDTYGQLPPFKNGGSGSNSRRKS